MFAPLVHTAGHGVRGPARQFLASAARTQQRSMAAAATLGRLARVRHSVRAAGVSVRHQSTLDLSDLSGLSHTDLNDSIKELKAEKQRRQSTLIIGAAGAVGKRLCAALAERGHRVIATDRMEKLPSSVAQSIGEQGTCVGSIDVTDADALKQLFRDHADENTTVWNMAAPLSVETALNPDLAEAVTVGGMGKVLDAMREVGARRICFTDSIGSYGAEGPRVGATARWLTENPEQDPGSDYGRQKRGCRDLMAAFAQEGGDPRFAILPGVLHSNAVWGNGTTEYALDALLVAPHQASKLGLPTMDAFVCPVDPDVRLPMVFVDDLMRGLIALQEADEDLLLEPQQGYCIPGLSFSANELFAEIRKHYPGFGFRVELDEHINLFANLWPDELAAEEPLRDLQYKPEVGLEEVVAKILGAHDTRNEVTAEEFKEFDTDESGMLTRDEIKQYTLKHLARGREVNRLREDFDERKLEAVIGLVDHVMHELDTNNDGLVSWQTFSEWKRSNTVKDLMKRQL